MFEIVYEGRRTTDDGRTPDHEYPINSPMSLWLRYAKNGIITFSRMFLIGSVSYLQVTMTCMRPWMSLKFGRIRPRTTELAALERMKKIHRFIKGKKMSSHFLRYFNWIFFIFAGNEDMHKSLDEFEIRPDATTGLYGNSKGYSGKKGVITFSRTI